MLDSLRARLLLWYALILAMVIVAFAGTVCYLFWRSLVRDIDANLRADAVTIVRALHPAGPDGFDLDLPAQYSDPELVDRTIRMEYAVWNNRGELIDRSDVSIEGPPPVRSTPATAGQWRELSSGGPQGVTILVRRDLDDARSAVLSLGGTVTAAGAAALALSLVGGWFLAGRVLSPIARISRVATAMAAGDLTARIPTDRTENELEQVALALNEGFDQLHRAAERERRFTADASHELRTPLATMCAEVDWALMRDRTPAEYRQTAEICRRAINRMQRIVEGLLLLARGDPASSPFQWLPVTLTAIVRDAVILLTPLATQKGIAIETRLDEVTLRGDADRLTDLVLNLVSNAIEYNKPGGSVRITLWADDTDTHLSVADTGIGIPAEHLPRIFERFYRADESRTRGSGGAGLGLAIAKWIVDAHRGQLECRTSAGQGTEMLVRLPAPDYSSSSSRVTNVSSSVLTARTVSGWLRSTPARARRFIG
jgi:signal transduction histidine kinase